jgi:hypothetical protein
MVIHKIGKNSPITISTLNQLFDSYPPMKNRQAQDGLIAESQAIQLHRPSLRSTANTIDVNTLIPGESQVPGESQSEWADNDVHRKEIADVMNDDHRRDVNTIEAIKNLTFNNKNTVNLDPKNEQHQLFL